MTDLKPISECYWVESGRLLAGEHPGHWDESVVRRRIVGLLDAGIRVFIDLSARADGVYPYHEQLNKICRDRGAVSEYLWRPLPEFEVPEHPDDVAHILRVIKTAIDSGDRVYLHCNDGVGRTGMVAGCWLVERGFDPEDALDELARRFAAMNKSRHYRCTPSSGLQAEWVENWEPALGLSAERSQAC
ncbi:MAG TPA: protein-tyrosine phosphatase family protein [Gammaproteobacteria bacterium]|nr:protein-tyrosine phosphatase family protein [Gammaproteobacteria bacterium]